MLRLRRYTRPSHPKKLFHILSEIELVVVRFILLVGTVITICKVIYAHL